jgi:predicted kinase
MEKKLILLRGLPGAGKSTFAKSFGDARHFEADMYHVGEDGVYRWKPENVKAAHEWCRRNVELIMSYGKDVVVSNTFTQKWEMDEYYELAKKYGYIVFSVVVENRHSGENSHNVPADTLDKMRNRFEIIL